jgi:hypothetical protein
MNIHKCLDHNTDPTNSSIVSQFDWDKLSINIYQDKAKQDRFDIFMNLIHLYPDQYLKGFVDYYIKKYVFDNPQAMVIIATYDTTPIGCIALTPNQTIDIDNQSVGSCELNWLALDCIDGITNSQLTTEMFRVCFAKTLELGFSSCHFDISTEDSFVPENLLLDHIDGGKKQLQPNPHFGEQFEAMREMFKNVLGLQLKLSTRQDNRYGHGMHCYLETFDERSMIDFIKHGRLPYQYFRVVSGYNKRKDLLPKQLKEYGQLWFGISPDNPFFESLPNLVSYIQTSLSSLSSGQKLYIVIPDTGHCINKQLKTHLTGNSVQDAKIKQLALEEAMVDIVNIEAKLRFAILACFSDYQEQIELVRVSRMHSHPKFSFYPKDTEIIIQEFNNPDCIFRNDVLAIAENFRQRHFAPFSHISAVDVAQYILHELAFLIRGIDQSNSAIIYPHFGDIDYLVIRIQKGLKYYNLSTKLGWPPQNNYPLVKYNNTISPYGDSQFKSTQQISDFVIDKGIYLSNHSHNGSQTVVKDFDQLSNHIRSELLIQMHSSGLWHPKLSNSYFLQHISATRSNSQTGLQVLGIFQKQSTSNHSGENKIGGLIIYNPATGHIPFWQISQDYDANEPLMIKELLLKRLSHRIQQVGGNNLYMILPEPSMAKYDLIGGESVSFEIQAHRLIHQFCQMGFVIDSQLDGYYDQYHHFSGKHDGLKLILKIK